MKDYSFYSWTNDSSKRTIIAFSSISIFQVRLPAGNNQTSKIHLVISIRDQFDYVAEYNMSSVIITWDLAEINTLIDDITNSSPEVIMNPIVQLLASENQNIVGQIITSLAQILNKFSNDHLAQALSGKSNILRSGDDYWII